MNGVLTKIEIARRQLGSATAMFIRDHDPVSVHCLACGAAELVEALGRVSDTEVLTDHILQSRPELAVGNRRKLREIRGRYWNAFKHVYKPNQADLRDDEDILSSFSDVVNDSALFTAWGDYGPLAGSLPIAAQVFQIWFFVMHEEYMAHDVDMTPYRTQFPGLLDQARAEQKRRLRRKIEWAEKQQWLREAEGTDPRPLVFRWP